MSAIYLTILKTSEEVMHVTLINIVTASTTNN